MRNSGVRSLLGVFAIVSLGSTACVSVYDPCDRPADGSVIDGGWKVVQVTDSRGAHNLPYRPIGILGVPELIAGSLVFAGTEYSNRENCDELWSVEGYVVADYHYNEGVTNFFKDVRNSYAGSFEYFEDGRTVTLRSGKFTRSGKVEFVNNEYVMTFSGSAVEFKKGWEALGTITVKLVKQR